MPVVDQPSDGVDKREVDNDVVAPLPIIVQYTAATLFSFISLYNNNKLYKKREQYK